MATNETRFVPWLCSSCGYLMDAATGFMADAVPAESDVSLCLNCGTPYALHGGVWRTLTSEEWRAIPRDVRRQLALLEVARRLSVT